MFLFSAFLRALWLLAALTFAFRDYQAEKLMTTVLDGKAHPAEFYISTVNAALAWFPFDQHMRNTRMWVLRTVAGVQEQERQSRPQVPDASSQRGTTPPDVGGGK